MHIFNDITKSCGRAGVHCQNKVRRQSKSKQVYITPVNIVLLLQRHKLNLDTNKYSYMDAYYQRIKHNNYAHIRC